MTCARLLALATPCLLCACAYADSKLANKAQTDLVGVARADLDMCAGLPSKTEALDARNELRSYEYAASTNNGVNLSFPVIGGGVSIGSGGYCHAQFRLTDGRVSEIRYAGATGIAGASDAVCAPIVQHCLEDKDRTAAAQH